MSGARAHAAAERAPVLARVRGAVRTCTLVYFPARRGERRTRAAAKAVVVLEGRHHRIAPADVLGVLPTTATTEGAHRGTHPQYPS